MSTIKLPKQPRFKWKSHKSLSAVAACVLPLAVYFLAYPTPIFRFLVPAFFLCVVLTQVFSRSTLEHLHEGWPWAVVRSSLFYLAWFLLFFLLPTPGLQIAYMLISVPVLYVGERLVGYTGETVLVSHTILTSFGLLLAAAAGEYYFHAGSALLTIVVFTCLFLLSRATYVFVPQTPAIRLASSLLVALFATEAYAAVLFLPFHFSVVGFLAFLSFYIVWLFTYYWQFGVLTAQRVKLYLIISAALAILLLLVTPWQVVGS